MPSRRRIDFNVLEGGVGLVRDASRRRAVAPAEDVHGLVHLGGLVANLCEALAARGRGETDVGVAVRVQNLRHVSVFHGDLEDVAVHVVDEDLNLPGELLDDVVIDVRILRGIERRLLNVEEALSVGRRRRARVFELRFGVRGDADDARRFAVVGETRRGAARRADDGLSRAVESFVPVNLHLDVRLDAAAITEFKTGSQLGFELGARANQFASVGRGDVRRRDLPSARLLRGEPASVSNLHRVR
mmetsp:Transcript_1681/g.6694  ORF Transcript_1681/g.6694 Transcript_1681/m.6694 type:complete len:245 (-) Transcript_1681:1117-1851(-)